MRILLIVASLAITVGCASYPVAPQTVSVSAVTDEEWVQLTRAFGMDPASTRAFAFWKGGLCNIVFKAESGVPSRVTLAHEIKHCSEGKFHP